MVQFNATQVLDMPSTLVKQVKMLSLEYGEDRLLVFVIRKFKEYLGIYGRSHLK